jgi:hypothetical protein
MTFPVWIPLGPWQLHPHLFFEVLACVHIVHPQDLRLIPFDTYNPRMPFPRNPL